MFRIDNSTAAPSLPDPGAAGTPGYYTEGVPGLINPTNLDYAALNAIQEELVAIATMNGETLDKATLTQCRDAIVTAIAASKTAATQAAAGIARFATQEEVDAGSADNLMVSPLTLLKSGGAEFITDSGDYTIPVDGWYEITVVGGGQGGDGGADGNGGTVNGCAYDTRYRAYKTAVLGDESPCNGGLGGSTSVSAGAELLARAKGGATTDTNYQWTRGAVDSVSNPGSCGTGLSTGGNGAYSEFGKGGVGSGTGDGGDASGYGAGGGGGKCQDGDQVGSYATGGSSGGVTRVLRQLSADDVITIVVGAGGAGYQRTHSKGGAGSPGCVMIRRM